MPLCGPMHNGHPASITFVAGGHVRPLRAIEGDIIRLAMVKYEGRMSEVARRLGIGRSTLYRKMAEHGIESDITGRRRERQGATIAPASESSIAGEARYHDQLSA